MKISLHLILVVIYGVLASYGNAQGFNKNSDLLIAQFDSRPDPDDIQAIAALGSMLAHEDFSGVNYYAVAGAYGKQSGNYIPAPALFELAFGAQNSFWTDAHNQYNASVNRIKDRAKSTLNNGGKVWVQEAGQSNITRDWVAALLADGVSASVVKNNVIVVQHSDWNITQTTAADLTYVQTNATFVKIDDGNDPGNGTPGYRTTNTSFINQAKNSPNLVARALWIEADNVIQNNGFLPSYSTISSGGVDFSDCAENWWIFDLGSTADSVADFWSEFVTNTTSGSGAPVGQTISLRAAGNNNYVSSDRFLSTVNWPLVANRNVVGAWEKFEVIDAGGGQIALRASGNGRYVSADRFLDTVNWRLAANRDSIGAWEKFTWLQNGDGSISLLANGNGRNVASDRLLDKANWPLAANRDSTGAWERFTIELE